MSRIFKDRLSTGVTPVADAFIDNYMAAANGEYVKVYLYILRHQNQEDLTLEPVSYTHLDHSDHHAASFGRTDSRTVYCLSGYPFHHVKY